jgi:hypothetical protein
LDKIIPQIEKALLNDEFQPNYNLNNHVIKVVCGKGTHSSMGIASLKYKVPAYLKEKGYDIYTLEDEGAVFIHLKKLR